MRLTTGHEPEPHRASPVHACAGWEGIGWKAGWTPVPVGTPPTFSTPSPFHRARMSAAQCLAHPWLNNLAEKAKRCNRRLKSQILLKKYLMKRRWKVPLGWGWVKGGAARREELLAPGSGPQQPCLGRFRPPGLALSGKQGWLFSLS